jgi:hypothetical protein
VIIINPLNITDYHFSNSSLALKEGGPMNEIDSREKLRTRNVFVRSVITVIAVGCFLFVGCTAAQSNRESPYHQAQPVNQQTVYKIGLICSLTGSNAKNGSNQLLTISGIVNKINSDGGIGGHFIHIMGPSQAKPIPAEYSRYKDGLGTTFNEKGQLTGAFTSGKYVEFVDSLVYDTNYVGDKSEVIRAASQLIQADVLAILGPSTSSETLRIIPLIEKAEIPLISFGGNPAITNPPKDWVFSANPTEAVSAIADALKSAGNDRNGIRQYLEVRLPREKK